MIVGVAYVSGVETLLTFLRLIEETETVCLLGGDKLQFAGCVHCASKMSGCAVILPSHGGSCTLDNGQIHFACQPVLA